jgi:hypothetical protein
MPPASQTPRLSRSPNARSMSPPVRRWSMVWSSARKSPRGPTRLACRSRRGSAGTSRGPAGGPPGLGAAGTDQSSTILRSAAPDRATKQIPTDPPREDEYSRRDRIGPTGILCSPPQELMGERRREIVIQRDVALSSARCGAVLRRVLGERGRRACCAT